MSWEVRTMRSVTSCFNITLFRKNLSRFWPSGAVRLYLADAAAVNVLVNGSIWTGAPPGCFP